MDAFSMAADEVGGDYYDFLNTRKNKFGLDHWGCVGKRYQCSFPNGSNERNLS